MNNEYNMSYLISDNQQNETENLNDISNNLPLLERKLKITLEELNNENNKIINLWKYFLQQKKQQYMNDIYKFLSIYRDIKDVVVNDNDLLLLYLMTHNEYI